MATIHLSLPETMQSFVDHQVTTRGYETSGEYMRDLLAEGANSEPGEPADDAYFARLRAGLETSP